MFGSLKKGTAAVATANVPFQQKISRLFIFRCLWVVLIIIPFALFSVWFGVLSFIHFFYMLLLGERSKTIFEHQVHYIQYIVGWQAYLRFFTNGHPPVLPWEMK